MARKFTARTIDGSKSVDLLASPYSVRGDIKIGAPTRTNKQKKRNGMLLTDQDWTDRNITWHQQIRGNDLDDLRANYRDLLDIITQEQWELVHNSGGATEQDRYYDCYAFLEVPVINNKALRLLMFPLDMAVEAKPFARGDAVDLPRNWVKDALIMESFAPTNANNDKLPNSFTLNKSGTPTYKIRSVAGATGDGAPLGYTEITVTGGANGQFVEIYQNLSNAAAVHSGRIEIQVPTAPVQANYTIQFDGGAQDITLVNAATGAEVNWTEKKIEGQSLGANANLYIRVSLTGSTPSATLRIHNVMLVQAATLPKGRDGGTLFYCSQVAESPATMVISNVPGDLDAPALATLQFVNTTARDYVLDKAGEKLYVGMGTDIDRPTLVRSYYGDGVDSECIGGEYGSAGYGPSGLMKMGRVFVFTRGYTNSASATTDTGYHQQFADYNWNNYAAYKSPVIRPFVNIGQSKWGLIPWGQFEIPILDDPDFDSIQNGIAPSGAGTYNDYHAFMPVEQNFRAEVSFDASKYLKIISDSISRNPGFYWERMASAGIEYPFSGASAIAIPGQKVFGEPFTLPAGKTIKMLALGTRYSEATYYRDKKTGVLMGIKYVPRFVE